MMVSFMRCYKKSKLAIRFTCALRMVLLLLVMLVLSTTAQADGSIQIKYVSLDAVQEGYELNVDAEIILNPVLEQALEKGVILYFRTKFSLFEPRWYWFDKEVAVSKLRIGLRYSALTRQYRLSRQLWSQNFDTLDEALEILSQLRGRPEPVDITHELKPGIDYTATLRMWLDLTRLPKPFQIETFGSSEWNLTSKTLEWQTRLPLSTRNLYETGGL